MRKVLFATCLGAVATFAAGAATANDELSKLSVADAVEKIRALLKGAKS